MRQLIRDNTALRRLYYRMKMFRAKGQSDESQIIAGLAKEAPRTFVEFGFHPIEFNCASLARNSEWQGLLIDGSARQVADARSLFPDRIKIIETFLTLDNLDIITSSFPKIGVLSIDVDGNDYWFLQLIKVRPSVICVEYNACMGRASITVPYDPAFERHNKHPSGLYHGASLSALAKLAAVNGYGLAAVSDKSCNAFFTLDGTLNPEDAWKPSWYCEQFFGIPHNLQWDLIKHLPFEAV